MSPIDETSHPSTVASGSEHRRIAAALVWVGLFVLLGKLAGAAKEMAIAWRYGVSDAVDAYVFVFNLITWPVGVVFSILTVVLLPLIAKLRGSAPDALPKFSAELTGAMLLFSALAGVIVYASLPLFLRHGHVGLSANALAQALQMAGPMALLVPLGMLISLYSAWMMACGHHRNTLLEALPAFAILCAVLLPSTWIAQPLVWGSVAGFALNLAGLAATLYASRNLSKPSFGLRSPGWEGFWGSIGIMVAGQVLISSTGIIDQMFAARLGEGAISSLNYANRIVALLLSLGGMAISRATLPVFSEVAAANRSDAIRGLAMYWAKIMAGVGVLAALAAWFAAPWIVQLLFQRGAFTVENTVQVTAVMRSYLIHVPFYFFALVMAAALSSQKRYFPLFITGVIALVVKPGATFLMVDRFGVNGVTLSSALLYLATSAYMTVELHRTTARTASRDQRS